MPPASQSGGLRRRLPEASLKDFVGRNPIVGGPFIGVFMSLPQETLPDDRLIHYLLGSLPEDEAECLDEMVVTDDLLASRLRLLENDLVDAYVSGSLTGQTLRRFETFYLASPRRREKVAFARRLLTVIDGPRDAAAAVPPPTAPARGVLARWFRWSSAVAAALLLATGVLLVQDLRLSRDLRDAERRNVAADQRTSALSGQLADQQQATAAAKQALVDARAAEPVATVALVLLQQTRGVSSMPIIAVESGSRSVPLELKIDTPPLPSYEVALRDPATNGIVWRVARLTPRGRRGSAVVPVGIPADLLKPQHYALELFGVRSGGGSEFTGSYAFEVVRP